MFWFVLAVILILSGAFWLGFAPSKVTRTEPGRYGKEDKVHSYPVKRYGTVFLFLGLVCLFFSTFTTVEAKQVGVKSTFGKVSDDTLSAGPHFKLPWAKVTEIDATVQTDEYRGDGCITVVLSDKNTACISATNRWSVNDENANDVYAEFRTDDPTLSLRDAVVSTQFKAAVNDVFGSYDATQEGKPDYDGLAAQVTSKLDGKTDGLVDIKAVTISYIKPSEKLQTKIEAIQAQEAKTRIATEALATAEKQAAANRALSESVSNDPNVLVAQCFEGLVNGDFTAPAGFSCWPGGGGSVVVPSAK